MKKAQDFPVAHFSESNPEVEYAGVGVNVISLKPGGGYQAMSGTSMAAPHVTGLIAALLSKDDPTSLVGYSSCDMLRKDLSANFSVDIGTEGTDEATGVGFATYLNHEELIEHWMSIV